MSNAHAQDTLAQDFVAFAVESRVLRFGEFKTKAGRLSPYFFNAGLFDDGAKLGRLAEFYARRLIASGLQFDMLFGQAYKGITLAAAVSIELARLGHNKPFAYNRKEAKDHGEGGTPCGVTIALDRQEKATANGQDAAESAVQQVQGQYGLPVVAIATLTDLMGFLDVQSDAALVAARPAVQAYRQRYGV